MKTSVFHSACQNTSSSKTSPRSCSSPIECGGLAAATRPGTTARRSSPAAGCDRAGRSPATAAGSSTRRVRACARRAAANQLGRPTASSPVSRRHERTCVRGPCTRYHARRSSRPRGARRRPARSWRPCGRARRSGTPGQNASLTAAVVAERPVAGHLVGVLELGLQHRGRPADPPSAAAPAAALSTSTLPVKSSRCVREARRPTRSPVM